MDRCWRALHQGVSRLHSGSRAPNSWPHPRCESVRQDERGQTVDVSRVLFAVLRS